MEILVFKTNLRYKKNVKEVMPYLRELKGVMKWKIDFHDKDKILRIVGRDLSPRTIEHVCSMRDMCAKNCPIKADIFYNLY
jgi:copper chaperone